MDDVIPPGIPWNDLRASLPYRDAEAFPSLGLPSPPGKPDANQALAGPYLDAASREARSGRNSVAQEYLTRGLELSPGNPDLLFCQAWMDWRMTGNVDGPARKVRAALDARGWYRTSRREACNFRFRLLESLGDKSALREELAREAWLPEDPDRMYWALVSGDDPESTEGEALLARALRRYPGQVRFMAWKMRTLQSLDPSDRQWFQRNGVSGSAGLQAQASRIRLMETSDEQLSCIRTYLDAGGKDPWVPAWGLMNILDGRISSAELNPDALLGMIVLPQSPVDLDVLAFLWNAYEKAGRDIPAILVPSAAWMLYRDTDRDGLPEDLVVCDGPVPRYWMHWGSKPADEAFISFDASGMPEWIRLQGEPATAWKYSRYPEISLARRSNSDGGVVEYFVPERGYSIPFGSVPDWNAEGTKGLAGFFCRAFPDRLAKRKTESGQLQQVDPGKMAAVVEVRSPGGAIRKRSAWDRGTLMADAEDTDSDGIFDLFSVRKSAGTFLRLSTAGTPGVWNRIDEMRDGTLVHTWHFSPSDRLRYHLDVLAMLETWDMDRNRSLDEEEFRRLFDTLLPQEKALE